jgi:microcystin-dependent protein
MAAQGTAFIADIAMYGFQFAPYQWTYCAGQTMAISQNQALFSLIGTYFGGNGQTTMGMPSLSSRVPVGFDMGAAPGLTQYGMGHRDGLEYVTLTTNQLPAHTHPATFTEVGATTATGSMKVLTNGASSSTPAAGSWIAGGNAVMFSGSKLPFQNEVEIAGLTVTGGGGLAGVVNLGDTGESQSHYNMPPFQAVNFSICELGLYPTRN